MAEVSVITIQKLTVRYDEREDRLLLAAQCDNGDVRGLWLTQRLATPLIRVVLKHLGEATASGPSVAAAPVVPQPSPPSASRQIALQEWEQTQAQSRQMATASPPVKMQSDTPSGLINEINVVCRPGGHVQLNFRQTDREPICLPLTATLARQWLGVLRGQYQKAEWHVPGLWPAWFDAALRPGEAASGSVH